jgi:acetate kinase
MSDANAKDEGATDDVVLCINSGSSSLKFAVFVASGVDARNVTHATRATARDGEPRQIATGGVERIGHDDGRAWLHGFGAPAERTGKFADHAAALDVLFALLDEARAPTATVVGHRVVHGGPNHVAPACVDDALVADLQALVPLAPLHLPAAIAGIEAVRVRFPKLPQVACFDTAFHRTMPEVARRLPLPDAITREGVRRYGFHGLSYEYVMSTLGDAPPSRIVIAHLGNGSSLVAVKDGKAIDTTMGFTPSGGVMMGTRTGDLDPGVLVYLLREKKLSADALEDLVERKSGLAAIGGVSDVKTLLTRAATDERARLALSMFAYSVRKAIGAFAAALGGIDLLIFTGGIGEHAAAVRADIAAGLEHLGVQLDPRRNEGANGDDARAGTVINIDGGRCAVRVVATDEDLVIARHVLETTHRERTR